MIKRDIEDVLRRVATQFKAVVITGPRQSGKTTLARMVFPDKPYVSLEAPDERARAEKDPRLFLINRQMLRSGTGPIFRPISSVMFAR